MQDRPTGRRKKSLAAKADRHALYERAVQDPKTDAATLGKLYRALRKKPARSFREDFCGTGTLATEWIKGHKSRTALGIDLDRPTLAWGRKHNIDTLGSSAAKRIELVEGNVLSGKGPKSDITAALNFSYCCFKTRKELVKYFKAARKTLKPDGLFVADVLGGSETMGTDDNRHNLGPFIYRWSQDFFDPLTHEMRCSINFHFPDGSSIEPAFTYDWRLWTMPELTDICEEAGFSKVHRMWERTDKKGEGTGVFFEPKHVENQESWWTYLIAER